ITAVADVQVDGSPRLLRDEFLQVGRAPDAEFLDVLRPVGVHGVRAGLFCCGNIRTGHDDALDFRRRGRSTLRRWSSRSRQLSQCVERKEKRNSDACYDYNAEGP